MHRTSFVHFNICHDAIEGQHCENCAVTVTYFLKVKNVNISKMVTGSTKLCHTTFIDVDICHRMASFRKFYFVTLTYYLKVEKFETLLSLKQLEPAQKCI